MLDKADYIIILILYPCRKRGQRIENCLLKTCSGTTQNNLQKIYFEFVVLSSDQWHVKFPQGYPQDMLPAGCG